MITIYAKDNFKRGYRVEGHANYGERGQDIICASVSAVTQTALLGLIKHTTVGHYMVNGTLDVEIYKYNDEAEIILDTMYAGLLEIAKNYPDYLQFKEEKEYEQN